MAKLIRANIQTDRKSSVPPAQEISFGDQSEHDQNCKYNEILHDQDRIYVKFGPSKVGLLMSVDCEPDIKGSALTPDEKQRLTDLEHYLQHEFKSFIEVGCILQEIRAQQLYKQNHANFCDYFDDIYERYVVNSPKCPCCTTPDLNEMEQAAVSAAIDKALKAVIAKRKN